MKTEDPPPGESGLVVPGLATAPEASGQELAVETRDPGARRLEEEAHQVRKMEAVGRLAGGLAHDFNNLLTVIMGYAQILQDGLSVTDPRREAVGQIVRATDRATSLTRQLLAFSRRQVLTPVVVDLGRLVHDLAPALRQVLGEDARLDVRVESGLWQVKADRRQIEQVVTNLVSNARDAMPEGGTVTLQVSNAPAVRPPFPEGAQEAPYVRLSVSDTGAGMDEETRHGIFEPYFTIRDEGRKTGLGLATAYGVVQQSGGFMDVMSSPGHGSTFFVHLPPVEEAVAPPALAEVTSGAGGSETILVVEDDDLLRKLAVRALKSRGYHVLEAGDGFRALQVCREYGGVVHLLLTDVVMPRMNGRQLAEAMAMVRPDVRVLFMSGHNQDAILQEGIEVSRVEFLAKPFTRDALSARVRRLLDSPKQT